MDEWPPIAEDRHGLLGVGFDRVQGGGGQKCKGPAGNFLNVLASLVFTAGVISSFDTLVGYAPQLTRTQTQF